MELNYIIIYLANTFPNLSSQPSYSCWKSCPLCTSIPLQFQWVWWKIWDGLRKANPKYRSERLKLILDPTSIAAIFSMTPGSNLAICTDSCEGSLRGLNVCHRTCNIGQEIVDRAAITAIPRMPPGNHSSTLKNSSEGVGWALNMFHSHQLILNCSAVASVLSMTPSDNTSVCQDGSKC